MRSRPGRHRSTARPCWPRASNAPEVSEPLDTFRTSLLAAVLAALALAATGSATTVFLAAVPSTVHRGARVYLSGSAGDCPRGDAVTIISRAFPRSHEFAGVPAAVAAVGPRGPFQAATRIPLARHDRQYVRT